MTNELQAEMPALVDVDWLMRRLDAPDLRVVDASWYLPAEKRNPLQEYREAHIPGAVFFAIDGIVDRTNTLPHMLPTAADFSAAMTDLGIGADSRVVIYDGHGLMSAARAWWMFRVFGHTQVAVLNGGLPAWRAAGKAVIANSEAPPIVAPDQPFVAKLDIALLRDLRQMRDNLISNAEQVIDARPAGRFQGVEPEPRPGLRRGHIPGALNLPFAALLDPQRKQMLSPEQVRQRFIDAGLDLSRPVVASCGSGVTACVLALGLYRIGVAAAVYDGSWAEWGATDELPVETG